MTRSAQERPSVQERPGTSRSVQERSFSFAKPENARGSSISDLLMHNVRVLAQNDVSEHPVSAFGLCQI